MNDSTPLVELSDVGKAYSRGAVAIENVDLSLSGGEFVSILGPSGCGKSTVLRLIADLTAPTKGVIRRSWDKPSSAAAERQPLGCVFQEATLLPWATVWDNVYLPLQLQGVDRRAAASAVDEMVALVGLLAFRDAYPRQLSGGMKMRTAAARALVTRPQLLLLDEPFAALDEITRQELNDDLRQMWRGRGFGALFITHSVYEAVYLSTRILIMSASPGRIVHQMPIDLPPDRDPSLRTSPAYTNLCRAASAALENAKRGRDLVEDVPPSIKGRAGVQ